MTSIPCPTPAKSRFATAEAAESAAGKANVAGIRLFPYSTCPCGWIHLTKRQPATADPDPEVTRLVTELGDQAFADLVRRDSVGRAHPLEAAALRTDEVVARWYVALGQLAQSLNEQLHRLGGDDSPQAPERRQQLMWRQMSVGQLRRTAKQLRHEAVVGRAGDVEQVRLGRAHIKDLRRQAGEVAIQRLIDAHGREFSAYVAEECERLGVDVPDRVRKYLPVHSELEAAA